MATKIEDIHVRIPQQEKEMIRELCIQKDIKMSQYVREAVKARLLQDLPDYVPSNEDE